MSRTAHWGTCDECMTSQVIYPHPDSNKDLPDTHEWDDPFFKCPVCGSWSGTWEGSDPAHELIQDYPKPRKP